MAHSKKFSMPPPLGEAKGGHRPLLGAKSVKYPDNNFCQTCLIFFAVPDYETCIYSIIVPAVLRRPGQRFDTPMVRLWLPY